MGRLIALPRHKWVSPEHAERLRQLALDLHLSPEARAEIDNALYRVTQVSGQRWLFVMISPEQFRFVMQATRALARPDLTWRVFTIAVSYMRQDTGEITATREQLASDAGASVQHVSRVMSDLTRIGAIIRHHRGRRTAYFVNPNVGWNGGEGARQEAAKAAPELRLVDSDSGPAAE